MERQYLDIVIRASNTIYYIDRPPRERSPANSVGALHLSGMTISKMLARTSMAWTDRSGVWGHPPETHHLANYAERRPPPDTQVLAGYSWQRYYIDGLGEQDYDLSGEV